LINLTNSRSFGGFQYKGEDRAFESIEIHSFWLFLSTWDPSTSAFFPASYHYSVGVFSKAEAENQ